MNAEELLRRYAAGERVFRKVYLGGVNMSRTNLRDIDLSGASLKGASAIGITLYRKNGVRASPF